MLKQRLSSYVTGAMLASSLLVPAFAVAELPSLGTMERVSHSVLKVRASACQNGGDFSGTGFAWGDSGQVVTALHLVAGCQSITVRSASAGVVRAAQIDRSLQGADLVLLSVEGNTHFPALEPAPSPPSLHEDIVTIGYQLDAPTLGSVNLKASFGSSRLADMLPPAALQEVNLAGMPSLSLEVLRHQGHLVPGLSGAPIINAQGRVVAVADGGLENGAVSIGWAIPISNVHALETSSESVTSQAVIARNLFAAELGSRSGAAIRCGTMDFQKLRSRTYAELASTSDDPQGLDTFKRIAELAEIDVNQLRFDVYGHLPSGATLVLPSDVQLRPTIQGCEANRFNGALQIRVRGNWPTDILAAAQSFLDDVMVPTQLGWSPDPAFSYVKPTLRFDGLNVDRNSYNGYRRDDPMVAIGMPSQVAHAFNTILGRKDAFLGIVTLNNDPRTFTAATVAQCQLAPNLQGCAQVREEIRLWVSMMISSFMSTFPIG